MTEEQISALDALLQEARATLRQEKPWTLVLPNGTAGETHLVVGKNDKGGVSVVSRTVSRDRPEENYQIIHRLSHGDSTKLMAEIRSAMRRSPLTPGGDD